MCSSDLQGPFIGHAERTSVRIWARTSAVGEYVLSARPIDDEATPLTANAKAQLEHDLCVVFDLQIGRASCRERV